MTCSFKLDHYADTLRQYKDAGYSLVNCGAYVHGTPPVRSLVMRHDLDFNDFASGAALKMAELEQQIGCNATYFVRIHGEYNPFSYSVVGKVRQLQALGHEIGLHFEPGMPEYLHITPSQYARLVWNVMEDVYDLPYAVRIISRHYAATYTDNGGTLVDLPGAHDVTMHGRDGSGKYLSDSGGRWREGCFCRWVDKAKPLFVCTHPTWWFEQTPQENF